jgi:hypothetical protein
MAIDVIMSQVICQPYQTPIRVPKGPKTAPIPRPIDHREKALSKIQRTNPMPSQEGQISRSSCLFLLIGWIDNGSELIGFGLDLVWAIA